MEIPLYSVCADVAWRKAKFQNAIEYYFAPIVKYGRERNNFDWRHLKYFYNNYRSDLNNLYCMKMFCEFAFKQFFMFNCHCDELVMKIIELYQHVIAQYSSLQLCARCRRLKHINNFPKHYHHEDIMYSRNRELLQLNDSNNSAVNNLRFTNRDFYARLAISSIYVGDFAFLQFLVKYGLCHSPDDVLYQTRIQLGTLFSNYVSFKSLTVNDSRRERKRFTDSILKRLFDDVENLNLKRINLIVLAVDISLCKSTNDCYYPDYVKCFNFYALTLPEAAISEKDIKDFLDLAFIGDIGFINKTYAKFKEVFPDTSCLPSARSLKYLCRCRVRDIIKKSPSFVNVLTGINIPICLKNYLLYMSK